MQARDLSCLLLDLELLIAQMKVTNSNGSHTAAILGLAGDFSQLHHFCLVVGSAAIFSMPMQEMVIKQAKIVL